MFTKEDMKAIADKIGIVDRDGGQPDESAVITSIDAGGKAPVNPDRPRKAFDEDVDLFAPVPAGGESKTVNKG